MAISLPQSYKLIAGYGARCHDASRANGLSTKKQVSRLNAFSFWLSYYITASTFLGDGSGKFMLKMLVLGSSYSIRPFNTGSNILCGISRHATICGGYPYFFRENPYQSVSL